MLAGLLMGGRVEKMIEKKCIYCENMGMCAMYHIMHQNAFVFNTNMDVGDDDKIGFIRLVDTMAYHCKQFKPIEDI